MRIEGYPIHFGLVYPTRPGEHTSRVFVAFARSKSRWILQLSENSLLVYLVARHEPNISCSVCGGCISQASRRPDRELLKLSIIIPVYNERSSIVELIDRLKRSGVEGFEWIFVDDGSTDGTTVLLRRHVPSHQKLIIQPVNQGKLAAVRRGLASAVGEWLIVQDADLEYDPAQIPKLLEMAELLGSRPSKLKLATPAEIAIYGERPSYWRRPSRWLFALGVLGVDIALFATYRSWVRDHATCYKLIRKSVLLSFELESSGFEGCVEITAKLMRSGIHNVSVPISYSPRSIAEGKKLTMSYGWTALKSVWKYRKWTRKPQG